MSEFIRVSSKSRFHGYPEDAPSMSGINIQTAMLLGVDPDACEVGTELLGRCGLATMRLSTVAELRKGISEQEACLVLCEEVLPDGDFRDVLKVVHDSKASVPVILFSRLADWDEYLAAVKLGAHDLLRFPFRTGELQSVIDRALASHPLSTS